MAIRPILTQRRTMPQMMKPLQRPGAPGMSDLEVPTNPDQGMGYAARRAMIGTPGDSTINADEFNAMREQLRGQGNPTAGYVDMRAQRGNTWIPGTPLNKGDGGSDRVTISPVEMNGIPLPSGYDLGPLDTPPTVNANGIPARGGRAVDPGQFTAGVTEAPGAGSQAPASTITPELQARADALRGGFSSGQPGGGGSNVGSAPGRAVLRAGADLAGFGAITPVQRGVAHAARSLYNSTFGGPSASTRRARASQKSSNEQQAAIQELTNSGASYDDALKALGLDQDPEWNPAMRPQVRGQGRVDPQFTGGYAAMRRRVTPG